MIDPGILSSALEKDFGFSVVDTVPVSGGHFSEVYSGVLSGEKIFVRINRDERIFPVEVAGYRLFAERGIPVPKVLGHKQDSSLGLPVMVESAVQGTPLDDSQKNDIYVAVGEALHKVHTIKLDGFGTLESEGDALRGRFKTWRNYLESDEYHNKNYEYLLRHSLISENELAWIQNAHRNILSLELPQAVFCHNDFQGNHVFTDGTKVSGVIDLGSAFAGDPRLDIAMSTFFLNPIQERFLKQGYGKNADDSLVQKYLVLVAAGKAIWRHENGLVDRVPKALARLRTVI